MSGSQDARGISTQWLVALASGIFLAGALIYALRTSGAVMLLHLGCSEQADGTRVAIFCLTNGTSKLVAYPGTVQGVPRWRQGLRTPSGWTDPYARCWMSSRGLATCVLQPGQSVSFFGPSSRRSGLWRAGVPYWVCEIRPPQNPASGNTYLAFAEATGFHEADAHLIPGSVVVRERTLMKRVPAKLPKLTPAWLKQYVISQARSIPP
jgi:hypothetical protein